MSLEQIRELIEQNKENEDVKAYLQGLNPLTVEGVTSFISQNVDAKKWFDSEKDKHYNKAFETWKGNNFEKLVDEEIRKRFPEKDVKDIELEKVKAELERIKADALRKELTNKALIVADEKKLPKDLVDYFIGNDEENTTKNLEKLESVFSKHIETLVQERLKKGAYTPPTGGTDDKLSMDDLSNMSIEEINKIWDKVK